VLEGRTAGVRVTLGPPYVRDRALGARGLARHSAGAGKPGGKLFLEKQWAHRTRAFRLHSRARARAEKKSRDTQSGALKVDRPEDGPDTCLGGWHKEEARRQRAVRAGIPQFPGCRHVEKGKWDHQKAKGQKRERDVLRVYVKGTAPRARSVTPPLADKSARLGA